MPGDPTKVYRAFHGDLNDLIARDAGGYRLKSQWFRNTRGGVSVDDGEFSSAQETARRHPGCGVASVPKSAIESRGLKLEIDEQDTEEDLSRNPAHRIVKEVSTKDAKAITKSARIEVPVDGWQVVSGDD